MKRSLIRHDSSQADDLLQQWQTFLATGIIPGRNLRITEEGGIAFQYINKTGSASVKGQAVNLDSATDDGYKAATDSFTVQGFVYESGIADGELTWVVHDGIADALLLDGANAIRGGWARLSATVAGRIVIQSGPGYQRQPSSVAYTRGSAISGALTDLLLDNGAKYVMGEQIGGPGLDVVFTWTGLDERLDQFLFAGYYADAHAAGVQVQAWNYTAGSWNTFATFPASGSSDVIYGPYDLTSDYYSAGEMKARLYHSDNGTAAHRIYLDQFVFQSSSDHEHFKELGHCMRNVTGGTNQLARLNIHLL